MGCGILFSDFEDIRELGQFAQGPVDHGRTLSGHAHINQDFLEIRFWAILDFKDFQAGCSK